MVQISGKNSKLFWNILSGRVTKIHPTFPLLSKDEGLTDIGHIMSTENLILCVNSVTVLHLIHYETLLQNATAILLQNATAILLQNATEVY